MHWQLWYAIPLLIAISLVYGATRHELMGPILAYAWRAGLWMVGFLGVIFAIVLVITWAL